MKKNLFYSLLFTIYLLHISCKQVIDVDLTESVDRLVIEAEIHDGPGPYYVKVSKSTKFKDQTTFSPASPDTIIISDNQGNMEILTQHSTGIYKTSSLQGVVGNTYYLTVKNQGSTYSAISTLNPCPNIDSFYVSYFLTAENKYPSIVFKDPADVQNNYRYFVRINNKSPEIQYIFEDKLINGTKWRLAAFRDKYKSGDSVQFFFNSIDRNNFEYYNILIQNAARVSGGNENASPVDPPSNIIGGDVLGYFSAHGRKVIKIVIP